MAKSTDNRRREVARFPIPGSEDVSIVTVSYPTFADMRRAYSLHVQPTRIVIRDNAAIYHYTPSEGYRMLIEEAPRYSARRLEALAADPNVLAVAERMHALVVSDRAARAVGGAE